jgi:hypothetical protein
VSDELVNRVAREIFAAWPELKSPSMTDCLNAARVAVAVLKSDPSQSEITTELAAALERMLANYRSDGSEGAARDIELAYAALAKVKP